jgi:hypothetical protein
MLGRFHKMERQRINAQHINAEKLESAFICRK